MNLDKNNFSLYVFILNIIITLFLLTTDTSIIYYIVTMISNVVAILLNVYFLKNAKKSISSILSFIGNIILPNIVTFIIIT